MSSLLTTHIESPPIDDELLATQAIIDASAFGELYQRHFDRVYRYHMARTGNVVDAQDLTNQTFLAAFEGIAGFRNEGSFCAWLLGIARRKIALFYRSRKPVLPLEEATHLVDPALSPEDKSHQHLQLFLINRALRQIKRERAEALELCVFGDLSATEAGQILGKSEGAVKMLVCRGIKDLRQKCSSILQEEK